MKNVTEIRKFGRRLLNDGKGVIEDGLSDLGGVLSKIIGLIQPGRDAVDDANQYFPELGIATNDDMNQSELDVQGLLGNFSEDRRRDINAIEEGIVAVTRIIASAKEEGKTEERARIKAEFEAGTLDISAL